jgi:hypothetical protein
LPHNTATPPQSHYNNPVKKNKLLSANSNLNTAKQQGNFFFGNFKGLFSFNNPITHIIFHD